MVSKEFLKVSKGLGLMHGYASKIHTLLRQGLITIQRKTIWES